LYFGYRKGTDFMEPDVKEQLDEILSRYGGQRNELIPILQEVQGKLGYLPGEVMQSIAKFLHIADSRVYGVATFYADFSLSPGSSEGE
jgi:NADH-quinone oxidoreductase subunit E